VNRFSIKDIEILTGIKPHTIRIWEQRYGILQPQRTATNIRYYTDIDLKLMLNVSLLNKLGFKISKITCLNASEIEKTVIELLEKVDDADINLSALLNCMVKLDEDAFEHVLNKNIESIGMENTMAKIVFPFLHRIGLLWQVGSITPAYEHFFTNLVRQKIITAIDRQPKLAKPESKKFLLFLPHDEPHELGLLYAHFLLRARGFKTIYMGLNLPVNHLECANDIYHPDFVVSAITTCIKLKAIEEFILQLSRTFPKSKILLSGAQALNRSFHLPQNVQLIQDFDGFVYYLEHRV
jgi:DNA-binding transcriptional MerR regulator